MKQQRQKRQERLGTATAEEQAAMISQAYKGVPADNVVSLMGPAEKAMSEIILPRARPVCPLCKREITLEESLAKNCEPLELNRRWVVVHKTCPAEVKP